MNQILISGNSWKYGHQSRNEDYEFINSVNFHN